MRAMVQGIVTLEAVVSTDGSVGSVRVTRSLHPDLDVSAVAALKAWKFRPATLNGVAVAVLAEVEMSFALR
jgi:TonB family protein